MLRAGRVWEMLPSTGPSAGDAAPGDGVLGAGSAPVNTCGGGVDGLASLAAGVVALDAEAGSFPTLRADGVAGFTSLGEVDSALTSSSCGAECGVVSPRAGAVAGVVDDTKAGSVLCTAGLSVSGGVGPLGAALGDDLVGGARTAGGEWMLGAAADRPVVVVGVKGFAPNPSLSAEAASNPRRPLCWAAWETTNSGPVTGGPVRPWAATASTAPHWAGRMAADPSTEVAAVAIIGRRRASRRR